MALIKVISATSTNGAGSPFALPDTPFNFAAIRHGTGLAGNIEVEISADGGTTWEGTGITVTPAAPISSGTAVLFCGTHIRGFVSSYVSGAADVWISVG